jgi:D-alanine-D-alanine ligase-like ATP-grasp enzyme
MRAKREGILLGQLFKKLAPKAGVKVLLEPTWKIAGRITDKKGAHRYFRFNAVDLNTLGSSRLASDKDYAAFFMRKLGYPVIEGKTFLHPEFAAVLGVKNRDKAAAQRYAKKLGFPLIVKPNGGSQGKGVVLAHNKKDLDRALDVIFKIDRVALIQKRVTGRDYRIVVLDNKIISAYERIPLNVTGDGRSTIKQLLAKKERLFEKLGRDTKLHLRDERIIHKLAKQHLSLRSVLREGTQVFLLDNANLSSGGDSVDVTETIHPSFKKIAIQLVKDMGLRFSGVDIMSEGAIEKPARRYHILEINDTPGLDHYASSGKKQQKIVEDLYLEVLKSLAR